MGDNGSSSHSPYDLFSDCTILEGSLLEPPVVSHKDNRSV